MRRALFLLAVLLAGCQQRDPNGTDLSLHRLQLEIGEGDRCSFGVRLESLPQPPFGSIDFDLVKTQHISVNGQPPGDIEPGKEYKIRWSDEVRRQQGECTVASARRKLKLSLSRDRGGLKLNWSPHSLPGQQVGYMLASGPPSGQSEAYVASSLQAPDTGEVSLPDPGGSLGKNPAAHPVYLSGYFESTAFYRGLGGMKNSQIKVSCRQAVEVRLPEAR